MKKLFFALAIAATCFTGCLQKDYETNQPNCDIVKTKAPDAEIANLRAYLTSNSITAAEDGRGFFYSITTAGNSNTPKPCNVVTVTYAGRLTNGTLFDSGTITYGLYQLITGWQEGLPLIGVGGKITLYLPPSLAYGASGSGTIPPNANLIFDIELKGFN